MVRPPGNPKKQQGQTQDPAAEEPTAPATDPEDPSTQNPQPGTSSSAPTASTSTGTKENPTDTYLEQVRMLAQFVVRQCQVKSRQQLTVN